MGSRGRALLLFAVGLLMVSHQTDAALTFQRATDVLGAASTLEEGTGLPTRNFTISFTSRSGSGRDGFVIMRAGGAFTLIYYPTETLDVALDGTSYLFNPLANFTTEELLMFPRTYTVTYNDAALSVFIDAVYIGTQELSLPAFPGKPMFGPDAIKDLVIGPYLYPSVDDEGVETLTLAASSDRFGLYGQLTSVQLWNYALNALQVLHLAASPTNLTGTEEGLCLFWRADRGYGTRIQNLGSAGSAYDGVLGAYVIGHRQTSTYFGSGCDATSATAPAWANNSGSNTAPTAENKTLIVSWAPVVMCRAFAFPLGGPMTPPVYCVCR